MTDTADEYIPAFLPSPKGGIHSPSQEPEHYGIALGWLQAFHGFSFKSERDVGKQPVQLCN